MYCSKCGKPNRDDALFCAECGARIVRAVSSGSAGGNAAPTGSAAQGGSAAGSHAAKQGAEVLVPQRWLTRFPGFPAGVFLGGYIVVFILSIVLFVSIGRSLSHDLEGTYYYGGRFPVTTIVFSKDGTFMAWCDYYEYFTGDVYYGKYSKSFGTYELHFTGGDSTSRNAVSRAMAESMDSMYSMRAVKTDDGSLDVTIVPGISYYAWLGIHAEFRHIDY